MSEFHNSHSCGICIDLCLIKNYIKHCSVSDIVFHSGNIIYIDCKRVICTNCEVGSRGRVLCYDAGKYLLYTINGALDPIVNECEYKPAGQPGQLLYVDSGFIEVPEIGNCIATCANETKLLYIDWLTIYRSTIFQRPSLYRLSDNRVIKVYRNVEGVIILIDNLGRVVEYKTFDKVSAHTYENKFAKIIIDTHVVSYISKTGGQTKSARPVRPV